MTAALVLAVALDDLSAIGFLGSAMLGGVGGAFHYRFADDLSSAT